MKNSQIAVISLIVFVLVLIVTLGTYSVCKEGFESQVELYIVYSMSNSPYQEWQADLLDYSITKSKQPGRVIRIVSDDPKYPGRKVPKSKIGDTIHTRDYSKDGGGYLAMNKPGGLENLPKLPENAVILLVDPDMIFTNIWDPRNKVKSGTAYGQKWKGYSKDYCKRTTRYPDKCPEIDKVLMYPLAMTYGDLRKILPMYYKESSYYTETKDWMTEMTALVIAQSDMRIIAEEAIGVPNDWLDQNNNEDAPILHYCQTIKDANKKVLWSKRHYKAWESVPEPSLALNRVDRGVLETLRDFIVSR